MRDVDSERRSIVRIFGSKTLTVSEGATHSTRTKEKNMRGEKMNVVQAVDIPSGETEHQFCS